MHKQLGVPWASEVERCRDELVEVARFGLELLLAERRARRERPAKEAKKRVVATVRAL